MASRDTAANEARPTPAPDPSPVPEHISAARVLVILASLAIVVTGIYLAGSLLVWIALAAFLAMVCSKPIGWLKRKGLNGTLALCVVLLVLVGAMALTVALVGSTAAEFSQSLPRYQERFTAIVSGAIAQIEKLGIDLDDDSLKQAFDSRKIVGLVSSLIGGVIGALSNTFMILLLVAFMLADATSLPTRLRKAFGGPGADLHRFYQVTDSVNTYLWVKTWISLLTGVCIGVGTAILGLDFPILWGFLAFIFNFIPNIGSLIAAVPAVLLGLVQGGWEMALWTAAIFLVVNNVIGNVVEPRVLGQKMGLSSLVVFLSLLVWSALLGPIGMILSVPLTMVIKIALESTPDGRGIAALLGDESDEA